MYRGILKSLLFILVALIASCERSSQPILTDSSESVVNGSLFANEDKLPFTVVLLRTNFIVPGAQNLDSTYCTGTLIQEKFVLTAAHCVQKEKISSIEVIFPRTQQSETLGIGQILVHKQEHDIALIKLKMTPPSPYLSLPLLKSARTVPTKFTFKALGFGEQNGVLLKKIKSTLELRHTTLETISYNSEETLFEVLQNKSGICFGDSGGPAIVQMSGQDYILGIAVDVVFNPSRAFESGYDRCLAKSLYLNVPYFSRWIEQGIKLFSTETKK